MSEAEAPAISFKGVSKKFNDRGILSDISFDVTAGEALCVMGRSGTGKSVTLKLMVGLLRPDAGEICIQNENIVGMDEDGLSRVRRKMGFLFQSAALFDSFSLNDNLAIPLAPGTFFSCEFHVIQNGRESGDKPNRIQSPPSNTRYQGSYRDRPGSNACHGVGLAWWAL